MDIELEEKKKLEIKKPSKYQVILLNDDYTSVEFVVQILMGIFGKTPIDSQLIAQKIHEKGRGVVGIYSFEIARTKLAMVEIDSRNHNYPLKATMEKIDD